MKLILELDNPQKLELLIEFLKDIKYIKGVKIIENKTPQKVDDTGSLIPLVIKPDQPLELIKKPTVKKFRKPTLDTKSFKFNREELHER